MAGRRRHLLIRLLALGLLTLTAAARAQQPSAVPVATNPGVGSAAAAPRSFDRIPPQEREAFQRNLKLWREISPAERGELRRQVQQRNEQRHGEAERALAESGLRLSDDQREVFILRYLQERRKLERELREKVQAERAQRLPEITAQLKKEFSGEVNASAAPRTP